MKIDGVIQAVYYAGKEAKRVSGGDVRLAIYMTHDYFYKCLEEIHGG